MNKWKWGGVAVAVVGAAFGASVWSGFYNPFESNLELGCEDIVKERLLAPSAYRRVSITRDDQLLTRDEYVAYENASDNPDSVVTADLSAFDAGLSKPTKLRVFIEYDAPNAYGTPIRGRSVCEIVSDTGKESDRTFYRIVAKVDGSSPSEWLVKQIRASQQ